MKSTNNWTNITITKKYLTKINTATNANKMALVTHSMGQDAPEIN